VQPSKKPLFLKGDSESKEPSVSSISLHPRLLGAVTEALANSTGKDLETAEALMVPDFEPGNDPGDISLAVAYANLLAEDPDMVTSYHLKMLRKGFSVGQIQELTLFIKKQLAN
jgi:hypothetical protein